jgi:uncharacterized cofD-like protein
MPARYSAQRVDNGGESLSHPEPLRIAALGGGTGLPNVLRGLCSVLFPGAQRGHENCIPDRLVAIVTTTDDGGSSGRLRRELGGIPTGDIRNCLAAVADGSLITELFQYRFSEGDGLAGHALGNLILTALADITGDFAKGIEIAARVVGARGRIVPATADPVMLSAELLDGRTVVGETAITKAGVPIRRLSLLPDAPRSVETAVEALHRANVILVGPGSLYTSVLPPLLVPQIREAVQQSRALKIFVLNLMTEPGETEGFDAIRHLEVVRAHVEMPPFDYVIFNTSPIAPHLVTAYAAAGSYPITVTTRDIAAVRKLRVQPLGAPLASEGPTGKIRHHPARLAATIAACARFDGRCASRPYEENNVRTLL